MNKTFATNRLVGQRVCARRFDLGARASALTYAPSSFRICLLALATALWLSHPALAAIATAQPPNIVFILTDDQRFDSISANGNRHIHTPNLDRLAARS